MGGSRGTKKSLKKCAVFMALPYTVKYALLHIVVTYFWIRFCTGQIGIRNLCKKYKKLVSTIVKMFSYNDYEIVLKVFFYVSPTKISSYINQLLFIAKTWEMNGEIKVLRLLLSKLLKKVDLSFFNEKNLFRI